MSIRWIIKDRATGETVTVSHPGKHDKQGQSDLSTAIKNMSRLSMRGGSLYEGK